MKTDLKERSTIFVSSWTRKHIFRLPAEVEYVPRHRRVLYIVYSLLSGVYSYLLMAIVVIFVYHILRSYTPEWAWLPALLLASAYLPVSYRHAGAIHENRLSRQEGARAGVVHAHPVASGWSRAAGGSVRAHLAGVHRWAVSHSNRCAGL